MDNCTNYNHLTICTHIRNNLSELVGIYRWEDGTETPAIGVDFTPESVSVSGLEIIVDSFPDLVSSQSGDTVISEQWFGVTAIAHDPKDYFQKMQAIVSGIQTLFFRMKGKYYPPTPRFHDKPTYVFQIWCPQVSDNY